jgi:hypothetical protein
MATDTREAATIAAEQAKSRGNEALQAKDFLAAVSAYTDAIELDSTNHVYLPQEICLDTSSFCRLRFAYAD